MIFLGSAESHPSHSHSSQQLQTKSLLNAICCAPKAIAQRFQWPLKALLDLICSSLHLQRTERAVYRSNTGLVRNNSLSGIRMTSLPMLSYKGCIN